MKVKVSKSFLETGGGGEVSQIINSPGQVTLLKGFLPYSIRSPSRLVPALHLLTDQNN